MTSFGKTFWAAVLGTAVGSELARRLREIQLNPPREDTPQSDGGGARELDDVPT